MWDVSHRLKTKYDRVCVCVWKLLENRRNTLFHITLISNLHITFKGSKDVCCALPAKLSLIETAAYTSLYTKQRVLHTERDHSTQSISLQHSLSEVLMKNIGREVCVHLNQSIPSVFPWMDILHTTENIANTTKSKSEQFNIREFKWAFSQDWDQGNRMLFESFSSLLSYYC